MNAYRSISCVSLLAYGALLCASDARAADAPFVMATANVDLIGGLSAANGDTRDLNRPVLVLQVGRTF